MELEDVLMFSLFVFLFLVIIILPTTIIFLNGVGGSEGQHTGYITAVERNHNVLWDANIVYFKTSFESTQEDKYCVNDEVLKKELMNIAKNRQQVTISFKNPLLFWRSICNGGISVIVEVEKLEDKK
jgi:hypothetical protein